MTHATRLTRLWPALIGLCMSAGTVIAQVPQYTVTNLGKPPGAYSVVGVRMNNLGHVAGWSQYFGQGEPSLRGWIWTPEDGFTVLDSPPGMYLGRFRAIDISDTGVVAGDGGFDSGLAWRLEEGMYTITGGAQGMPIAYLGGVNNAGDIAGTAKDATITTPDYAWLDVNGGGLIILTPGGGRATDVNNSLQVSGYSQGPASGFEAFRWDADGGLQFLGTLGLAYSFASAINDAGQVVGSASSASGNTSKAWIYTDGSGMEEIPAPVTQNTGAAGVNIHGHVVGTSDYSPDFPWLWAGGSSVIGLNALFNHAVNNINLLSGRDINDAGQILASGFDNVAGEFRTVLLTPPAVGACCLGEGSCLEDVSATECDEQAGDFLGAASQCAACTPTGACCLTDGSCESFLSAAECGALAGTYQADGSGCGTVDCPVGVTNDDCADAASITLGDTVFSTLGATTDGPAIPQACDGGTFLGMDIWYLYEPDGTGTLTVSTCNQASYDTNLAAYTGACGSLEIVGCNDDIWPPTCYGSTSIMDVPVTCGEPVLLRVGSFSVYTGTGTLTLSFEGDPCATRVADLNDDGVVGPQDLAMLLGNWGPCDGCASDLDGDGMVGAADLAMLLGDWG